MCANRGREWVVATLVGRGRGPNRIWREFANIELLPEQKNVALSDADERTAHSWQVNVVVAESRSSHQSEGSECKDRLL